jgi:YD repeat-containing protein
VWDYANRFIAFGAGGATTTYGYDAFGQRVRSSGTALRSQRAPAAKYATTTSYMFKRDTLLATVDQQTAVVLRSAQLSPRTFTPITSAAISSG